MRLSIVINFSLCFWELLLTGLMEGIGNRDFHGEITACFLRGLLEVSYRVAGFVRMEVPGAEGRIQE